MLRLLARLHNVREAAWDALREDRLRGSRGNSSDMCAWEDVFAQRWSACRARATWTSRMSGRPCGARSAHQRSDRTRLSRLSPAHLV